MHKPGWVGDFQAFIMRGNVVDLAVGIIIGAAFTSIVQSLVKDIFNPVIGLLTGGIDFSDRFLTIKGPVAPTIAAAKAAGAVTINYGLFVNAVIQFLIVAFVVFWLVRTLQRFMRKQEDAPTSLPRRRRCSPRYATYYAIVPTGYRSIPDLLREAGLPLDGGHHPLQPT